MYSVKLYDDLGIQSVYQIEQAYIWCVKNCGEPSTGRWRFGLTQPGFLGLKPSSIFEYDLAEFAQKSDYIMFLLTWST